mgnify:CR=1 FL=1
MTIFAKLTIWISTPVSEILYEGIIRLIVRATQERQPTTVIMKSNMNMYGLVILISSRQYEANDYGANKTHAVKTDSQMAHRHFWFSIEEISSIRSLGWSAAWKVQRPSLTRHIR